MYQKSTGCVLVELILILCILELIVGVKAVECYGEDIIKNSHGPTLNTNSWHLQLIRLLNLNDFLQYSSYMLLNNILLKLCSISSYYKKLHS
uniref:Secreted protein n=1 Tax=Physcomitrium patens TaxID=3218 RepID=A0A7I3Z9I2_PHYPA